MTKPNDHWNVLPHGTLTPIDDNMLTVEGRIKMPLMDLPRRMTVVRLRDARLVVWSAIALDEPAMATLEAFGQPAFLIVPNDHHRLDAKAWKNRYPQMQVVAPEGAREKIADGRRRRHDESGFRRCERRVRHCRRARRGTRPRWSCERRKERRWC